MKKLLIAIGITLLFGNIVKAERIRLTTTTSASVDRVGAGDRSGVLFKFDLPATLQNAHVDVAYLNFQIQSDSSVEPLSLLARPMLTPWASAVRLALLPEEAASPLHVSSGRLSYRSGTGRIRVTHLVRAWLEGELPNQGLLVYTASTTSSFRPRNLQDGSAAELEITYTKIAER